MYRKNTAGQHLGFRLVHATTGAPLTGAVVSVKRVLDGGLYENATGSVAEKGGGLYDLALAPADTNGNQVSFLFAAAGAVPEEKTIVTTAADPADPVRFGLANLDVPVSTRSTLGAAAVWDEPIAAHLIAGTVGSALNGAGTAGDPWNTPLPGAYASGTAGHLLSHRLDAPVSSCLPAASVPANFASLAISTGGLVDCNVLQVNSQPAQTSTDPVAANLVQVDGQALSGGAVPATVTGTIAANLIQVDGQPLSSSGGAVPATLVPSGLDAIGVGDPGGVAQMNSLPRMVVALWRRFYKKTTQDAGSFRTYGDDGSVANTVQATTDNGTVQTVEAAQ